MEKKIKNIKATTYSLSDDDEGYLSSYIEYDENGNVVYAATYQPTGDIETKTTYVLDLNSKLVEETNFITEDEISEKIGYTRNDGGHITGIEVEYGDGSKTYKNYDRDEVARTININIEDEDGEFEGRELMIFNEQDMLIEKTIWNDDNQVEEAIKVEYAEFNGKLEVVKESELDKQLDVEFETIYNYDDNGDLISKIKVNHKRELVSRIELKYEIPGKWYEQRYNNQFLIKREYNEKGKIILEEEINSSDICERRTESLYDENDLLIEEKGLLQTIKYEYEFYAG